MEKRYFGTLPCGTAVNVYTLKNESLSMEVLDRGCAIRTLVYNGIDTVRGFDTLDSYLEDTSHQGAAIGRVANRIAGARFMMNGTSYSLPKNDGENCLHGGDGFDHKLWKVEEHTDERIVFSYVSKDGEEGFPGELTVKVSYTLEGEALVIGYEATPESMTPVALTNHSYFNLNGHGDIEDHLITIHAERYTEVGEDLIPNGNRPEVAGTVFDLRKPTKIGKGCSEEFIGYDHNFVLSPTEFAEFGGRSLGLAAEAEGEAIGMKVYTDQEGVQFYIGNFLGDGPDFKGGEKQVRHGAFCLETQTEPDCVNHGRGFYGPGEVYTHTTVYKFYIT